MANSKNPRWKKISAWLTVSLLLAGCADAADSGANDIGSAAAGRNVEPQRDCPPPAGECQTCSEHLLDLSCPAENLCSASARVHDEMQTCTEEFCGDACTEHESPVSQECAICAVEFCTPEVTVCANDTPE